MTFSAHQQPNHDRAKAARKANSPWRKSTTLFKREREDVKKSTRKRT